MIKILTKLTYTLYLNLNYFFSVFYEFSFYVIRFKGTNEIKVKFLSCKNLRHALKVKWTVSSIPSELIGQNGHFLAQLHWFSKGYHLLAKVPVRNYCVSITF